MSGVESLLRQAAALHAASRHADAAAAYEAALAQRPDMANAWYNLGLVQRRIGKFDAALASYQRALDLRIAAPEGVHINRSVIFMDDLHRYEDAERELRVALTLAPDCVPALLNLATLSEDRGRRAEAADLYDRALRVDPACWEALSRRANLKRGDEPAGPFVARLRAAIARSDVAPADRASLGFALGKTLDADGDHAAAFAAYVEANAASAQATPPDARYDRARHERYVDDLIRVFPDVTPSSGAVNGKPPVFICGMFRSGSTLAEQVLAGHPRVTAGGEIGALPSLIRNNLSPYPAAVLNVSAERLAEIARRYLDVVQRLFPDGDIITDKRPENFLHIGLIKALMPDAKFIHTVRNPLDNCLSVHFLHLDASMSYALDLMDTGHYFAQYRRLMAHWKALHRDDIFDFDYDAFVEAPRETLEPLLAFCGLDWDDRCLAFHDRPGIVKTASVWQVRQPLYQASSGRWQNYQRELAPLRAYLDASLAN